ncbi:hypothetical protein I4U23_015427 [Adineta vaga]|nr:hypothetical protein I4U23_015427 [Adineta vaga]
MYGSYGAYRGGNHNSEMRSDLWIQRNVPGGLNSALGERLDNYLGGNPNPTFGQVYGGAPGVGGYNNYGSGYGYSIDGNDTVILPVIFTLTYK